MTIAKDFASKLAVAFVAIAMILVAIAPAVQAAEETTEDLQQTINDLLAQVAALQADVDVSSGEGSTSSASFCPYTWTRDLSSGATGEDVMKLQQFLNSDPDTRVAATGAGSVGMETSYYGPATAGAVSKFQVKYRAEILSPVGLVNPTGYYGSGSRAKANSLCVTTGGGTDDGDDDDSDDTDDTELSGEGSLDVFEIDDASDTDVQEGAEDVEIAELTMEATDGDIEVDRFDLTLTTDGDNTENDPWEVFESITLWVDGDMIAEFDASDEDEYLDEDEGTFRFTDVGLVLMEDEEVEILVGATIAGSVDDAGQADEGDWTVAVDEVRYFDADGVADDDDTTGQLGDTAAFEVVEAGDGEELKFGLGDNNPEATDIIVDENDSTDGVTILEYTIEAEEGDIELNTLVVRVDTTASTTATVDDVMLVIDGEEFDAEALVSTNKGTISTSESRYVDNNVSNDAVWYVFDIDGDVVIDMDSEVTAEVVVDFKSQSGNYDNGDTIQASVTSVERDVTDAEGADDIDTFSGTAVGEDHTLVAEGIVVPADGFTSEVDTLGTNDTIGEYVLEFEVTAVEGDFYIKDFASTTAATGSGGIEFAIDPVAAGTITATFESTADEDTSTVFTVQEGETETFTLTVTYDPAAAGAFRVQLEEVWYSTNTDGVTGSLLYTPTPAQDFRSDSQAINQ